MIATLHPAVGGNRRSHQQAARPRIGRDAQFWAAVAAACLFWTVWGFFHPLYGGGLSALATPAQFFLLIVVYPVLEEAAFRGALQAELYRRSWGPNRIAGISVANLITSLAFSGAHLIYHPPLAATLVIFPSLLFGYFRDRYHRVGPAIALHVWYNAGFFWAFGALSATG